MMITWVNLRAWDPEQLHTAADALGNKIHTFQGLADELDTALPPGGWQGQAATLRKKTCDKLINAMENLVAEAAAVRTRLHHTYDQIVNVREKVIEADEWARRYGYVITDRGDVVDNPDSTVRPEEMAQSRANVKAHLQQLVKKTLHLAEAADDDLADTLHKAERGKITDQGAVSLTEAARAGDRQGDFTQGMIAKYHVPDDPGGMTKRVDLPDWIPGVPNEIPAMTAKEWDLIKSQNIDAYNIQALSKYAVGLAKDPENGPFKGLGFEDGHSDAFRHAYWNALLAREYGVQFAEDFTTAHEGRPDNPSMPEAMDLHNNAEGRRIFEELYAENPNFTDEDLVNRIKEKILVEGKLLVVDESGQLAHSNEVPPGQTTSQGPDEPQTTSGGYDYSNPGGVGNPLLLPD